MSSNQTLTVVIPTLDEAECLPALLDDLRALDAELLVVDGGSTDRTGDVVRSAGVTWLETQPGRAHQLNEGAARADGDWLFFLHADSRVPPETSAAVDGFLAGAADEDFATFGFALAGESSFYRFIEFGQRLRERSTGLAYGDQGLLVSRSLYDRVGGYPDWPILEDVGMLDRLRRLGRRNALPQRIVTSPRRYQAEGNWRNWIRHTVIIGRYRMGASPHELAQRYPRTRRAPQEPSRPAPPRPLPRAPQPPTRQAQRPPEAGRQPLRRAVIVFAKAPRPGYVKTRLAVDVGTEGAARIYRQIGRATVDAARSADARAFVYYDPPDVDVEAEMLAWLGAEGVRLRPQRGPSLGARMSNAFAECLAEHDAVCLVGTDTPGVSAATLTDALDRLAESDVVIGPATDGGYYLLALGRHLPELFEGVPWSTSGVLEATLARVTELGVGVALLGHKTDVDTAADVPPELLPA